MTSTVAKKSILSVYRKLLKTANGFPDLNFRDYTIRTTRNGFRNHIQESDPVKIRSFYDYALSQLALVERQTTISRMYSHGHSVLLTSKDVRNHMDDDVAAST
eukprot:28426_1